MDKDTIRIYFAPRPSGNFTATMPACRFDSSMIIAHTWPIPNNVDYGINYFDWNYGSGIIWDNTVTLSEQDTIYVSWSSGNSHSVSLATGNIWGCISAINQHTIHEPPLFSPSYSINPATCGYDNGEVILSTSGNTYSFLWLDTAISNPSDTGQFGLASGQPYYVITTGQSLSPDATPGTLCHDTISILIYNAGNTTALFDTMFVQNQPVPRTILFLNESVNGYSYSWRIYDNIGNLVNVSSLEHPSYTFTDPGCYRIVLISTSKVDSSWFGIARLGCKDTFEYKWLCFVPTSVEEIMQNIVSIS